MESFTLYGGEVEMTFNDATHRYTVKDSQHPGVTITPPSITTVLSVINKPALIPWAVRETVDFLRMKLTEGEHTEAEVEAYFEMAKDAHKLRKKEAADIGTQAHNWLEQYWRSKLFPESFKAWELPKDERVRNCVQAALKWIDEHKIEPILIEKPVYSRQYRVSGRLDKLALVDGRLAVVDWKSSKGLWPEYQFQTAAYTKFFEEEDPETRCDDRWLVQLGKETGEFHAARFDRQSLEADFEAFAAAVTLYRRLQELNRR